MTIGTGNFAEELWPGIRDHWQYEYDQWPELYSEVFYGKRSDKAFEKEQGIIGLPAAQVKDQGNSTAFVDLLQGNQKEYVNVSYSLGSGITKELYDDEQYGIINDLPRFLARGMRETMEITHFSVYNNGFTTALSGDGLSIFNVAHVMGRTGSTLSNRGQSGVTYTLSQTSLENACIFISDWTDDSDLKIRVQGIKLLVPTALQFTAQKILETEYEVNTGNNTINPIRGKMIPVVSPYLTDSDAWFVVTDVTTNWGKGFVSQMREAPDLQRDNEFSTRNMLFSTFGRWDEGCTDFRGAWGSPGT